MTPLLDSKSLDSWKVLVIDDEPDIIHLTKISLKRFEYSARSINFLSATNVKDAKKLLIENNDIALALIDVVMEENNSGLELVEFIRSELNNGLIRIIIRTGQPNYAPERFVIDNYDIDGYVNKAELTAQKLYSSVRGALKSFRDLNALQQYQTGMEKILLATPEMYHYSERSMEQFFEGILHNLIALCGFRSDRLLPINSFISTKGKDNLQLHAGTGVYKTLNESCQQMKIVAMKGLELTKDKNAFAQLESGAIVIPLNSGSHFVGFIYLEPNATVRQQDIDLLKLFANQCATAIEFQELQLVLQGSYEEVIDMLARVAEYKDSETGGHIFRISQYAKTIAKELKYSELDTLYLANTARLHDVGKVGIPEIILNKPGSLTAAEFEVIKTHSTIGEEILKHSKYFKDASLIIRSHHERWDGTGYPDGLAGEEIPIYSRIISVVDVFDALLSQRPYKKVWKKEDAYQFIKDNSGTMFDSNIVDIFTRLYEQGKFDHITP